MNRILVIDDEQSIRELLKDFLETKGFEVLTASDGESGLELLREDKFDLFLLDLMMPGISGLELLKKIKISKATVIIVIAFRVQIYKNIVIC